MGCSLQEGRAGTLDDDIIHVFARTNGTNTKYYYRRCESGYWPPWEKVSLNIEGDLLLPVIWKSQLFVFWVTAVHKPQGANSSKSPSDMATDPWTSSTKVTAEINLGWGEYYKGKWMSPKSSEFKDPIRLTGLDMFEPEKLVVAMRTEQPRSLGTAHHHRDLPEPLPGFRDGVDQQKRSTCPDRSDRLNALLAGRFVQLRSFVGAATERCG